MQGHYLFIRIVYEVCQKRWSRIKPYPINSLDMVIYGVDSDFGLAHVSIPIPHTKFAFVVIATRRNRLVRENGNISGQDMTVGQRWNIGDSAQIGQQTNILNVIFLCTFTKG